MTSLNLRIETTTEQAAMQLPPLRAEHAELITEWEAGEGNGWWSTVARVTKVSAADLERDIDAVLGGQDLAPIASDQAARRRRLRALDASIKLLATTQAKAEVQAIQAGMTAQEGKLRTAVTSVLTIGAELRKASGPIQAMLDELEHLRTRRDLLRDDDVETLPGLQRDINLAEAGLLILQAAEILTEAEKVLAAVGVK